MCLVINYHDGTNVVQLCKSTPPCASFNVLFKTACTADIVFSQASFKSFGYFCIQASKRLANKSPVPVNIAGNFGISILTHDLWPFPRKIKVTCKYHLLYKINLILRWCIPEDPELKELPKATNVLFLPSSELVITTDFVPLLCTISMAWRIWTFSWKSQILGSTKHTCQKEREVFFYLESILLRIYFHSTK